MSTLNFTTCETDSDLKQIIDLQKNNLSENLSLEQRNSQGFVTVQHDILTLRRMNDIEPHIIAKDNERVVAYLLAMTEASKSDIPVLIPMFETFDNTPFNGKKISAYNYIVVGQVCVASGYRGAGVLDNCYNTYKAYYAHKYDFAITEIAASNLRSFNAHKRMGFELLKQYKAPDGESWDIVLWDWNQTPVK